MRKEIPATRQEKRFGENLPENPKAKKQRKLRDFLFKPTQYCPITEAVSEIIPNCEGQVIPDCEKMLQEEITETSHDITDCWGGGDVRMVGTEAGGVLATITVLPAGLGLQD